MFRKHKTHNGLRNGLWANSVIEEIGKLFKPLVIAGIGINHGVRDINVSSKNG